MLETELADSTNALTEENGVGWQTAEQWGALHDFLVEYDAISSPIAVEDAFTTGVLP